MYRTYVIYILSQISQNLKFGSFLFGSGYDFESFCGLDPDQTSDMIQKNDSSQNQKEIKTLIRNVTDN